MKLIVQIPCHNEEATIARVIYGIPKSIKGISKIEVMVIDDGSTDQTVKMAKRAGANYIISHKRKLGLAKAFYLGLGKCLEKNADIIVNTDGDNQYDQSQIVNLVKPILEHQADMVIGNRQVERLSWLPLGKKIGNIFGSWVIRRLTGVRIKDASSGFRAFSRHCAKNFIQLSDHTYTHETIIQAHENGLNIIEIPANFRPRTNGQSRLISNTFWHIHKSALVIIRMILLYKAIKFFTVIGISTIIVGIFLVIRFMYYFTTGEGRGHIQSLVIASIFVSVGFNIWLLGIITDAIATNRKLIERIINKL